MRGRPAADRLPRLDRRARRAGLGQRVAQALGDHASCRASRRRRSGRPTSTPSSRATTSSPRWSRSRASCAGEATRLAVRAGTAGALPAAARQRLRPRPAAGRGDARLPHPRRVPEPGARSARVLRRAGLDDGDPLRRDGGDLRGARVALADAGAAARRSARGRAVRRAAEGRELVLDVLDDRGRPGGRDHALVGLGLRRRRLLPPRSRPEAARPARPLAALGGRVQGRRPAPGLRLPALARGRGRDREARRRRRAVRLPAPADGIAAALVRARLRGRDGALRLALGRRRDRARRVRAARARVRPRRGVRVDGACRRPLRGR